MQNIRRNQAEDCVRRHNLLGKLQEFVEGETRHGRNIRAHRFAGSFGREWMDQLCR